jgi:hypothetical protein
MQHQKTNSQNARNEELAYKEFQREFAKLQEAQRRLIDGYEAKIKEAALARIRKAINADK